MSSEQSRIGFLGLGIMGTACARRLFTELKGSQIVVWNRTASKCDDLVKEGAERGQSAGAVVASCDITFGMLSDPAAAIECVEGAGGVLEGMGSGKAYVDMSTVDEGTSKRIEAAVTAKGGRYLEAPVSGSKGPAINGQLVILAGGDASLFKDATPMFDIMGKRAFLVGAVGAGARMKLVVNMVMGGMMTAFCEGMSLADKAGLSQEELLEVLSLGAINNPMFSLKGPSIVSGEFPPAFPLKHQQKDMRLALELGGQVGQALPVATAADEVYKAALSDGHGDEDFAAVYTAVKK